MVGVLSSRLWMDDGGMGWDGMWWWSFVCVCLASAFCELLLTEAWHSKSVPPALSVIVLCTVRTVRVQSMHARL